ncbi:MAG: DUF2167 domain-containing protein [Bacteroidales bacterium]
MKVFSTLTLGLLMLCFPLLTLAKKPPTPMVDKIAPSADREPPLSKQEPGGGKPVPATKKEMPAPTEKKAKAVVPPKKETPAPAPKEDKVTQVDGEAYQLMLLQHLDSVNRSLKYETGEIELDGKVAKIKVPSGFKFLNAAQSRTVLEDLWGNPPQTSVLGMLFPENATAISDSTWAFIINYEAIGYVEDKDATDMDYDDLLKQMKEDVAEDSKARVKEGYPAITLIGWADTPHYDASHKTLHWAKEVSFAEEEEHTLNYGIRVLGRKGVLSLNAVGSMANLNKIKPQINRIVESATFGEGNKYSDFDPSVDKVAAWTIGGLVAGKVLAKVGFFAFFAKFAKVIFVAIAAGATAIWRWIRGRSKE